MCTVSFYRNNQRVILTSNRDESIHRPSALAPRKEYYNETALYYPKDPQGGGSWFVVNEHGDAFVLLNGADSKHIPVPPYAKSRGLILLELSSADHFMDAWQGIDTYRIEPFTIVVWQQQQLILVRWNGRDKQQNFLDIDQAHIWSSYTLYDPEVIAQREAWFIDFMAAHNHAPGADDLFRFHTQTQREDHKNGLIINRHGKMLTKNVTQFVGEDSGFTLSHHDLITSERTKLSHPI